MQTRNKDMKLQQVTFSWLLIGILGRLLPHPANFTLTTSLCLFAGAKRNTMGLSRFWVVISTLIIMLLSDVLLAYLYGYPVLSYWSLFTYSGFVGITLSGFKFSRLSFWQTLPCVLLLSFSFWLWTNFGVWLTSVLYAKTFSGLLTCYFSAIPFLKNALFGDLIWFGVIFGVFELCLQHFWQKQCKEKVV